VILDADVARAFPTSDAVNDALRELTRRRPERSSRRPERRTPDR